MAMYIARAMRIMSLVYTSMLIYPFLQVIVITLGHLHSAKTKLLVFHNSLTLFTWGFGGTLMQGGFECAGF